MPESKAFVKIEFSDNNLTFGIVCGERKEVRGEI